MPIDYSKWNNLELSDDSDVEVHPNIERGTFIRLRQQKIRQDRDSRKQQLVALEAEIPMNKKLITRINELRAQIDKDTTLEFGKRLLEWSQKTKEQENFINDFQQAIKDGREFRQLTLDEMLDGLIYRVQQEIVELKRDNKQSSDIKADVLKIIDKHVTNLKNREPEALKKIEEIKKEMRLHLSVDDVSKEGFSKSIITKDVDGKKIQKTKTKTIEVLNPGVTMKDISKENIKESEQELKEDEILVNDDDVDSLDMDPDSKEFGKIQSLEKTREYIINNVSIMSRKKSDQIMAHAFELQMEGKEELAKLHVRQSLVINYVMQMGPNGMPAFFNKITIPNSPGNAMFFNDVEKQYKHISERCKILIKEQQESAETESIQLQTDDPNNVIRIYVPSESNPEDADKLAIFKQLPTHFQDALKAGTLDAVNESLAKVTGPEAEDILAKCGSGGFLIVDEEIIVENE
ncbi:Hsp90 co-chaperone Cdc37 [Smittium culicis]|uniref:Hsp90 chaperone protein kinase-targeting subunit n=1 Tax=Smittium culicis TaxID=133412 RepID=A0A1R1XUD1_9FUNG|nr:Hsp90 co-chaperone Cdc37 [Smittium culicis]OMJ18241.1 Hsp90 co-chaperone Cdc37 [Smittium culicis]